jgi:uncharacterized membrane protein
VPDARPRVTAVDALRGLVMVIMALDHTRDFLHAGAMHFSPDDLARTTPAIFLTRWITHLCAPVFVLTAGLGARLRREHGDAVAAVSRFLWTRGLWLIAVELVVMRLAMNFTFDWRYPVLLIILWALGWSMIALAGLVHLPPHLVGAVGLAIVLLHNMLDGVQAASLGVFGPLWTVLHQPGVIVVGGVAAVAGYPILPWIGVMAVGYWIGGIYAWDARRRQQTLFRVGVACIAAFLALRTLNGYGDPSPWSAQARGSVMTAMSFLDTTKYPPSLTFVLMTLGPALLLLSWFERLGFGTRHLFVTLGRVPFAYYVVHFLVLHVVAAIVAVAHYGTASLAFLWHPLPSMGGARDRFPPDLGVSLAWTYVAWILLVAALYGPARWLAGVKSRRRDAWLAYL